MKKPVLLITSLSILASLAGSTWAAEQEQVVIDDLTAPQLRAEIEKIQSEFYRVFNSLNEDDDYDIICQKYTETGTNISDRACEPRFMIDRRGENAKNYQAGLDDLLTPEMLVAELQSEFELLTEKMNEVARQSDYFRELNQILGMLRARLAELTN
jgi:hypothetical protein